MFKMMLSKIEYVQIQNEEEWKNMTRPLRMGYFEKFIFENNYHQR